MEETCHVCGQPLDELYAVSCVACGRKIHFQSTEPAGNDCGHILMQLGVCGLAFMCNPCSDQLSASEKGNSASP